MAACADFLIWVPERLGTWNGVGTQVGEGGAVTCDQNESEDTEGGLRGPRAPEQRRLQQNTPLPPGVGDRQVRGANVVCPNFRIRVLARLGPWCEERAVWMKTGHPGPAGVLVGDPEGESAPGLQNPAAPAPSLLLPWSLGVWLQVQPPEGNLSIWTT